MKFRLQGDKFVTSRCVLISVVFSSRLLLFQTFILSVPGEEIDSDNDSFCAGNDGKGSIWASLEYYYTP